MSAMASVPAGLQAQDNGSATQDANEKLAESLPHRGSTNHEHNRHDTRQGCVHQLSGPKQK